MVKTDKLVWVDIIVHTTDVDNPIIEIESARLDRFEIYDNYVQIGCVDNKYVVIPMDSLLYLEYKITE